MELSTRAAYRGQVTKIVKLALDYLKDDSSRVIDQNEENFDEIEEELISHVQRLTSANNNLNAINEDIKQKGFAKDDESLKCVEYQDQAINALARLNTRLERLRSRVTAVSSSMAEVSTHSRPANSGCKLPKLTLKRFDGSFSDWLPFWEQFRSAVHENTNLSAPEKFNYLESVVTGDAKRSISGFTPSEKCYKAAIGLLQERYGSTEKLIDNHIQQLVGLSSVRDRNDTSGLRNLYGTVISCTRSLTALQVPTTHYYVMLRSILLRCLPTALRIEYHRQDDNQASVEEFIENNDNASLLSQIGGDEVTNILRFLKREIESLEMSGVMHASSRPKTCSQSTASSLVNVSATEAACIFCKSNNHKTKDCDGNISINEKRQILRSTGRCFRCARAGHSSKKCRTGKFLSCSSCKGKHMTSMCDPSFKQSLPESDSKIKNGALNLCAYNLTENVLLKTVRCAVAFNAKHISIRAIIDGGSQHTYIRESVVRKVNLKTIGTVNLSVIPFGCKEAKPIEKFAKVKVNLQSLLNREMLVSVEAIVVPEVCVDVLSVPEAECPLFEGIQLSDVPSGNIEIEEGLSLLIGSDFYWNVVTGKQRRLTKRLRAVETVFGWTLQGLHVAVSDKFNSSIENPSFSSSCLMNVTSMNPKDLTQFWSLEAIGIKNDEDENSLLTASLINKCITKQGSRYVAKLPWKDYDSDLQDNRGQAFHRLNALVRRLSRDPVMLLKYDEAIRKLINDSIAEPVPPSLNESCTKSRVFYLPHQPVYKEEGTTKLRVVFDASAHSEGARSLNDHLWTGANLLPDVLKVLLNFRLGLHGIVADIEKAFLQIALFEEDRDSHRFIWFDTKLRSSGDRPEFAVYRMTRVTFGVNCSPFLLCATIQHHLKLEEKGFPSTCDTSKSIYMDDLVVSTDDEQEGIELCSQAVGILKRASMNLHKWNSSSQVIRDATCFNNAPLPSVQKVLGLTWFTYSDELSVSIESVLALIGAESTKGTKRNLLQVIARIFDPIGILGPTIIKLKILFQKLWKRKVLWDDNLTGDLLTEWNDCLKAILELKNMMFPRAAISVPLSGAILQIHVFADASTKAYGSAAFVKSISPNGKINASFLCAKNRVAPLKMDGSSELTLPKLELTAALIAARLHSYLRKCLKFSSAQYFLWTDSKITLCWIQGDVKRWQPYVQNRVDEIRRHTDVSQWHHCSGRDNPADLLTRGISGNVLQNSEMWAHGPSWLTDNDNSYMREDVLVPDITTNLFTESVSSTVPTDDPLVCYENYSSWKRLLRVTAFIFRAKQAFKRKTKPETVLSIADVAPLCSSEIQQAENYWLRYVQGQVYSNEISLLQKGKALMTSSKILELSPFLNENIILRLGGRLQTLHETRDLKHPVILPPKSYLLNLIIDDFHERACHAGVNTVLSRLRRRFWIVKGRQAIKKRLKKCVICRKLWGAPASQPFAPLPIERVSLSRPFDNVGVDFAGPLYCFDDKINGSKIYVAIFTCSAVRAVHLEITRGLSTEHFLLALRRFVSRRGVPSLILSDNARTFKRAALELRSPECFWDEEVIQGFLSKRQIQWQFIVERAPWWGGFWERLIRTMKNLMKVTIGKAKLDFEQLRTLVTETEEIVNSRPLTYMSSDPLDLCPLTPADFLIEPRVWNLEIPAPTRGPDAELLRSAWKCRMKYKTKLRKRWHSEYLQLLRSFHNLPNKGSRHHIKEGDVVLVYDQATPRIQWKMAIVEKAFQGRDSKVRSCQIRLPDGKQLRRPIQLLYPLEVQPCPPEDVKN